MSMMAIPRLLFIAVLLGGCTHSDQSGVPNKVVSGSTSKGVTLPKPEQLPSLKMEAMSGSPDAALQLALWYMKFPSGNDNHAYWTQVAAENGSEVGQFNFGILLLSDESNPLNRIRARYWLTESASQGSEVARAQLAQLDESKNP